MSKRTEKKIKRQQAQPTPAKEPVPKVLTYREAIKETWQERDRTQKTILVLALIGSLAFSLFTAGLAILAITKGSFAAAGGIILMFAMAVEGYGALSVVDYKHKKSRGVYK